MTPSSTSINKAEGLTKKEKFRSLEASRGMAAVLVILVHVTNMTTNQIGSGTAPFGDVFRFGHAGVDFFFVLSGFIILFVNWDNLGKHPKIFKYMWRRVSRIYPTYWVITAATILLYTISPSSTGRETELMVIVKSLLLFPQEGGMVMGVAWTLVQEMIFYTLFSFLILSRLGGAFVMALWFAWIIAGIWGALPSGTQQLMHTSFQLEFFMGMLAAILVKKVSIRLSGVLVFGGLMLFLGTAVVELNTMLVDTEYWGWRMGYGGGAMLLTVGMAEAERKGKFAVPDILFRIGSASYSIYLTHAFFAILLIEGFELITSYVFLPLELILIFTCTICISGGVAYSHLIEQPILRWSRTVNLSQRSVTPA